ncbi:MAG: hypothetical protein U9P72_01020 [Campylobacterota bacterium]|nr:hypothetical protein [Campylobacterota bacterium]
MNPIIDGIMIFLFILFMVFIFGGYHKNKSSAREEQFRLDELKKKKEGENS